MRRAACLTFFSLVMRLPAHADPAGPAEREPAAAATRPLGPPTAQPSGKPSGAPKPRGAPKAREKTGNLLDPYPAPAANNAPLETRARTARQPERRVPGQPIDPYRARGPAQAKLPIDPYRGDRGDDQGLRPPSP